MLPVIKSLPLIIEELEFRLYVLEEDDGDYEDAIVAIKKALVAEQLTEAEEKMIIDELAVGLDSSRDTDRKFVRQYHRLMHGLGLLEKYDPNTVCTHKLKLVTVNHVKYIAH